MRHFLRVLGWAALSIVIVGLSLAATSFVVHHMQLRRLARLSEIPIENYETETSPFFVLSDVNVIDGTGRDELKEQSIVVRDGKIAWVGPTIAMPAEPGAKIVDLRGASVIPGLVMLHEHLFTTSAAGQLVQQSVTFPSLYLAAGVTTARTAGSIDALSDLRAKQRIDQALQLGPELFLTAPYLEGSPSAYQQMHALQGPADASASVDHDLAQGFTSLKAYTDVTPDELQAAIAEAHAKSAPVTGHLCSITYTQAAAMGIDNLEHGLLTDTEFFSGKKPNVCPPLLNYLKEYRDKLDVTSPEVLAMIDSLVAHHVAVTSTMAVLESELDGDNVPAWYQEHAKNALIWKSLLGSRISKSGMKRFHWAPLLVKEEQFEKEFVHRGGTLLAGADPTGDGSVLAGFADLRELELLNKAGFTPAQAIQISTLNGARFLGIADRTGSIEAGKQADLVVLNGDPAQDITHIREAKTVYRLGRGYDAKKIRDDVIGVVGLPN